MNELRITNVKLGDKNYPLVYSLNASEIIEEQYVQIENLGDLLLDPKKHGKNSITIIKDIIYIMISEGIKYCEFKGIQQIKIKNKKIKFESKLPDYDELYQFIDAFDIANMTESVYRALLNSKKKQ